MSNLIQAMHRAEVEAAFQLHIRSIKEGLR